MDEDVKIVVSAVDKASAQLKNIGKTGKTTFTELTSAIGLANRVFGALKGFIDDTAGATLQYANQVRALQTAIGATPQEASKLIQVADDVGISFEQMNSAMEAGIRKGVKPTIENIAALSDEYLALAPGIDRTEFLMKKFGRTGQDLARLMELGSDKIEEMGDSIEGTARLMDEKAMQAAEDYRISLDNMNDSATDLKLTIGQKLIPTLNDFIVLLNDMMTLEPDDWFNDGADAAANFINGIFNLNEGEITLKDTLVSSSDAAKEQADIFNVELKPAVTTLDATLRSASDAYDEQRQIIEGYTSDAFKLTRQMDDLKAAISGNMDKAQKEFARNTEDLRIKTIGLKDQVAELESKKYLTDDQKAELSGLRDELDETEAAIGDLADAHDEATKRILYGMLEQKLAANGLTTEEGALLQELAKKWGLIDQATLDAQLATTEATAIMESNVANATQRVNWFYDAWSALSTLGQVKDFMIRVAMETSERISAWGGDTNPYAPQTTPNTSTPQGTGKAAGGFVLGGVSYPVGELGTEMFTAPSNGYITPNNQLGGDNISITINALPGQDENAIAVRVVAMLSRGNRRAAAGAGYAGV